MRLRLLLPCLLLVACGGASPDSGVGAALRVEGAQYVPGALDSTAADAGTSDSGLPTIHTITTINGTIQPGSTGHTLGGTVSPGGTAVLIGLRGDTGHWVVPVSTVDQNTPGDFAFSAKVTFGYDLPAPPLEVVLRATNREGEMGPPKIQTFGIAPSAITGAMVISLEWDTQADLDLHVQFPSADGGIREVSTRKRTSAVPAAPGDPPLTDDDYKNVAYLDMDSNAQCVIDGERNENVIWPITPEAGTYTVRVDTFSMCGELSANWLVRVFIAGEEQVALRRAGQSMDVDTRFTHGTGAGVEVLTFNYQP
jgi:hypothetical protein